MSIHNYMFIYLHLYTLSLTYLHRFVIYRHQGENYIKISRECHIVLYSARITLTNLRYFSRAHCHTQFDEFILRGTGITPTSEFRKVILLLLIGLW